MYGGFNKDNAIIVVEEHKTFFKLNEMMGEEWEQIEKHGWKGCIIKNNAWSRSQFRLALKIIFTFFFLLQFSGLTVSDSM